MGERKGTNHYYPPDFDPAKHKSLNGYHGVHPLRERAKKIKQGIMVIRFEMPYNIWCGGCKNHVGMGVRYNAEKSKVGMYYTTPIYKFRMKCHLCDNYIEMQTDPQNCDYVILSGARRKEQRWDASQNEQIVTDDRDKIKKLATDPMFKIDHEATDKTKIKTALPGLGEIELLQTAKKDDYILNKMARQMFRGEKKQLRAVEQADRALLDKSSLDISLVAEHDDDVKLAGLLRYKNTESFEERQKKKRIEIDSKPLFGNLPPKVTSGKDARKILLSSIRKTNQFTSQESSKSLSVKNLGIVRKTKSNTEETISINPESNCESQTDSCDMKDTDANLMDCSAEEHVQQTDVTVSDNKLTRGRRQENPDFEMLESGNHQSLDSSALSLLMQEYSDSESSTSDKG
ncbi:probable splicing factor YJU2B [Lineus longissimus]|uniref:probable splicing factor YJU2B n=1 Tax=Lineus longissimus TaxID=88925 RepID=UPI002B4F8E54